MSGPGRKPSVSKPVTRKTSTATAAAIADGNQGNSTSSSKSKIDHNCGSCNLIVMDEDDAIECELCKYWFHCTCQNVSKKLYDTINDVDCGALHWYCRTCNGTAGNMLKILASLQTNHSKLTSEVKGLKDEMKECKVKISNNQQKMEEKIDELKKDMSIHSKEPQCSTEEVEKLVADKLDDFVERERRKNNIIVYGIPESLSQDAEVRKKEDRDQINSIFHQDLNLKADVSHVRSLYRLGKKSDLARPLKVVMDNGAATEEVFRRARSLKSGSVQIARDRTKAERDEHKRLRNVLKERIERGEENLVIRGGKVIKRTFRRDGGGGDH